MNIHKVIFFSFSFFATMTIGYMAAQQPNFIDTNSFVGMRCEFNGSIQFSFDSEQMLRKVISVTDKIRDLDAKQLHDALDLREVPIKNEKNQPSPQFKIVSSQWVWLSRKISIQLTLIPDPNIRIYSHEDVYFFNVFNNTLFIKLSPEEYAHFVNKIYVCFPKYHGERDWKHPIWTHHSEDNLYVITLEPGLAIKYPVSLNLPLKLKTQYT